MSTSRRAPCSAQAPIRSSTGARAPSADCTAETATKEVPSSIFSARCSRGTSRTSTPCSRRAIRGKVTELNSSVAVSTREPGGRLAATVPTNGETWVPMATSSADTPLRRAWAARTRSTTRSESEREKRPVATSVVCRSRARNARWGVKPYVAVSRKVPCAENCRRAARRRVRLESSMPRCSPVREGHAKVFPPVVGRLPQLRNLALALVEPAMSLLSRRTNSWRSSGSRAAAQALSRRLCARKPPRIAP